MAEKEETGAEELIIFSTLSILHLIKEAQQQHGLRHGDFQRYRAYCSRKIRRVRKSLKFTHTHKSVPKHPAKFAQKRVALELISDPRYLLVPLFESERAWAHAMQLKQEAAAEENHRKKFHMAARLRKAAKQAAALESFCKTLKEVDAPTKLEASAYAAYITGCLHFETQAWPQALEHFTTAKTIYERLSSVVKEGGLREVYKGRVSEMGPQLRFCAYNIGDESAIADLMSMRLKLDESGGSAGIGGDVERLVAATLEKQQSGDSLGVEWGGRRLSLATPHRLATFANAHAQFQRDLEAAGADRLALHDKILIDCRDAIQSVKDEASKAEGSRLGPDAGALLSYLSFLRLRLSNTRYLLMCQAARTPEDGKLRTKPGDLIRLYDTILANVGELSSMTEVKSNSSLSKELAQKAVYFKAFRCYSVAEAYAAQKKWPEALALFHRAAERATTAAKTLKALKSSDLGLGPVDELGAAVRAGRQRASAGALLEKTSAPAPDGPVYDKPLVDELETWRSWKGVELVGKAGLGSSALVSLPPPFRPMPGKPLFFDLALNHIKFPSLEDKVAEPPQASPKSQNPAPGKSQASQAAKVSLLSSFIAKIHKVKLLMTLVEKGGLKEGEGGGAVSGLVSGVKGWFWGSK